MRKESLKKNGNKNGVVDDDNVDDDMTGGANNDNQDPLQGVQPALEQPSKKKGRKKNDTVVEVAIPLASDSADVDYEVEDIIDHKFEKKNRLFLVRWKNCTADDDTWEPESALSCPEIVEKYLKNHPDAESESKSNGRKRAATKKEKPAVAEKKKKQDTETSDDKDDENNAENEDDQEYEVEDIVNHKIVKGKTQFLIRWKNYDSSADTWEPELTLSCPEIIQKYKDEHMKDIPTPTKASKKELKPKKEKVEKDYEVHMIVDEKMQGGVKHYLVRWKGYKMDDDTWEPEESLNCPDLIEKFHEFKKNKRTSAKRGAPKKPVYIEVEETEGEEGRSLYVNGSKSNKKGNKSKASKGKQSNKKQAKKNKDEEDYEVEAIVGEKTEGGKKYYLLKWKDWPSSSNTWEVATSLNCPDILKKYQAELQNTAKNLGESPTSTKSPKSKSPKSSKGKSKSGKKSKSKSKSKKSKSSGEEEEDEDEEEEEQDWEVEKIVDVRYHENGTKDFLIRWKGCEASQDTWEPENNVNSPDLIEDFMSKTDPEEDAESDSKKKTRKS